MNLYVKIVNDKTSLGVELNLIPSIGVYFVEEGETNISTCLDKAMIAKTTVKRKYLKSL
ncbi:hypothetical protein [Clostridioides difficile]|uniref:hypothetical protein n=1 Tax=Clostridioides difficile TaxID=1496 RepID=UPI001F2EDFC1|nr:hypothetical protein [Clostridioides difficile]